MTPSEFIRKWKDVALTERSACHEHFLDLCALVGHPTPVAMDKTGDTFTFEKGVSREDGGQGWADVWKKGFFGWEYKGPHADLAKAYAQLLRYREALENPPLLVVCDMNVIEVHTNFTGTAGVVHTLPLAELDGPRNLEVLRALFHDPEKLKPGVTSQAITAQAARHIGELAQRLRDRGDDPHAVARFLDRLVFCMFAEDIGLLQDNLFTRLLDKTKADPERLRNTVGQLFDAMASGGTRYTPTTCFETFPFPWPPGQEPQEDPRVQAIAAAAKELNALREAWLNPPEWTKTEILEFPVSRGGPWARFIVPESCHSGRPAEGPLGRNLEVPSGKGEILRGEPSGGALRMTG